MKRLWANKPTPAMGFAALMFALSIGSAGEAGAQANIVPMMTIKIFNDDPNHWVYPVLTAGKRLSDLPPRDVWLQSFFGVPLNDIGTKTYRSEKLNRIYINPSNGIAPGKSITLRIPLFTQLVKKPDPTAPDQYISWWNGSALHLYYSDSASPPQSLQEALANDAPLQITSFPNVAILPRCPDCQGRLKIYNASGPDGGADLPKNDPHQLIEFTLGARITQQVKNPAKDPPNTLDVRNVDFDVSYVNIAYGPAAMGPFGNDQVGYVGTPQTVDKFRAGLTQFLKDYPKWPQFVRGSETLLKPASPLEVFARLGPSNPPPDLTPPPSWPDKLWPPIQALRDNWLKYAGTVNSDGICKAASPQVDPIVDFCDAIVNAKQLMLANYRNYKNLFGSSCTGTPVNLTDDRMIAHVYGWAPFTEAASGKGCQADGNLLQNTPGYYVDGQVKDYSKYQRVKLAFDRLNYGTLQNSQYAFNPWVMLIHGKNKNKPYLNTPNAYAYSVDDAVGNIQASASGIIIDVGSTKNLENRNPASPPININYAYSDRDQIRYTRYRVCVNDKAHEFPVNPAFNSFIINANNPQKCPIFFFDNKAPPQLYTFTLTQEPPYKVFADPSDANWKTANTPFNCKGNTAGPPFQDSSGTWCCNQSARNGIYAFSQILPDDAHHTLKHNVQVGTPPTDKSTRDTACNVSKRTQIRR